VARGIAVGVAGWALLWEVRSSCKPAWGGHSSWIPHTTPARFVAAISARVTDLPRLRCILLPSSSRLMVSEARPKLATVVACASSFR